jgi:hypothetical protein
MNARASAIISRPKASAPPNWALAERELESTAPFEPPAAVKDDRRLAELLYAASLRSVDPSRPDGRGYVEGLAGKLELSPGEAARLRRRVGNR